MEEAWEAGVLRTTDSLGQDQVSWWCLELLVSEGAPVEAGEEGGQRLHLRADLLHNLAPHHRQRRLHLKLGDEALPLTPPLLPGQTWAYFGSNLVRFNLL